MTTDIDGPTAPDKTRGRHDADWYMLPAIRASKRKNPNPGFTLRE